MPKSQKPTTIPERRRRIRKQIRRKAARHQKASYDHINPMGVLFLVTGDIPEHLQQPLTLRGVRRLNFEVEALHFLTSSGNEEYLSLQFEDDGYRPKLPRFLRPAKSALALEDSSGLYRFPSGHYLSPGDLTEWYHKGELRMVYLRYSKPDMPRPGFGWSVIYRKELEMIFPRLNLDHARRRSVYFLNIVRNEYGAIMEVRVFSEGYMPLFRLNIEIPASDIVFGQDVRSWWTTRPTDPREQYEEPFGPIPKD